jgi:hypothetical protein
MDMSLIAAVLASQAGAVQQQVANSVLKSNLDTEKSTVLTLLGAGQNSSANLGAGIGGNLDVSA